MVPACKSSICPAGSLVGCSLPKCSRDDWWQLLPTPSSVPLPDWLHAPAYLQLCCPLAGKCQIQQYVCIELSLGNSIELRTVPVPGHANWRIHSGVELCLSSVELGPCISVNHGFAAGWSSAWAAAQLGGMWLPSHSCVGTWSQGTAAPSHICVLCCMCLGSSSIPGSGSLLPHASALCCLNAALCSCSAPYPCCCPNAALQFQHWRSL